MSEKYQGKHEARILAVETLYALDFNNELNTGADLTLLPGKSGEEMAQLDEEVVFYARRLIFVRTKSRVQSYRKHSLVRSTLGRREK